MTPSFLIIELMLNKLPRSSYRRDGKVGFSQYTYDNITGYSLRKNINDSFISVETDSYGNRKGFRDFDPKKKSIVLIGDSTVFGWGVRDEETFAYKIGQNEKFSCLNIVNLGVPSYSLGNISEVIKYKANKYNPAIIFTAVLWPWKAFEDTFYGPNPKDDWKKVNKEYFKKKVPLRYGYVRNYFWGANSIYFFPALAKNTIKSILASIDNFGRKSSFSNRDNEDKGRFVKRPGVRDFEMSKEEELNYANDHFDELRIATNDFFKNNSINGTKFIYYLHPYSYTINHPEYSKLGELGYQYLRKNLPAMDFKNILNKDYLNKLKVNDLYFDGSHLKPLGHKIWAKILSERIAFELEQQGISCSI
tara:strand:+ start:86 stop:1171 length:1086 start_codon:yes stop_codon:yes gene_type:complete